MANSKWYAVAIGRIVGIFDSWAECEKQVGAVNEIKGKEEKCGNGFLIANAVDDCSLSFPPVPYDDAR